MHLLGFSLGVLSLVLVFEFIAISYYSCLFLNHSLAFRFSLSCVYNLFSRAGANVLGPSLTFVSPPSRCWCPSAHLTRTSALASLLCPLSMTVHCPGTRAGSEEHPRTQGRLNFTPLTCTCSADCLCLGHVATRQKNMSL